ncbi:MAG: hypothetical protein NC132_03580 [Corallococcus sp.]|nr:hypothetical protein [Corallococcus sp.]MCM1359582.1 hypothetical protein [Corallococcus sp.]MCM1395174.1 hypothetical protein [Corallococcus sp.]
MIKFGTGGFRGVIGDDFTKQNVQLVSQALATVIKEEKSDLPVAVGFDHRFCSDRFAQWVAQTLAANGIPVLLYDEPMPTPAIMAAVRDEKLHYGVMITASHNPYYFNGVKLFVEGGMDADVAFTNRLETICQKTAKAKEMPLAAAKSAGLVRDYSNKRQYLDNIKAFVDPKVKRNKANVLYDNLWGVGASCIAPLFKEVGIKNFTVLHTQHDAFFNFEMPNPTEANMLHLREVVLREKYDFAFGTDSDSDRLGILDEKGNYVSSNDILAALYYYLVKYRGMSGDVVKNCATSVLVDKVAEKLGFKCHEVDVGFKNISAEIKCTDALIGGESSGGLTVRGYIFGKDSVFSSMLFTEMVIVMDKPVSQIIADLHQFADYNFVCVEDQIGFDSEEGLVDYLQKNMPSFGKPVAQFTHFNRNFKYIFSDGSWALIRLSGTEPVFRVFAEFPTAEEAYANIEVLRRFIADKK